MTERVFAVVVRFSDEDIRFLVRAATAEAAAARPARLFGADRVVRVEAVPRLRATGAPASVRADVLTSLRDFTAAGVRPSVALRRALPTMPPRQRAVVAALLAAMDAGAGIGEALRMAGFPEAEARLVEAGERTGRLVEMASAALDLLRAAERLRSAIRRAAVYPAMVLAAVFGLGVLFRLVVLPGVGKIFGELGEPVPRLFAAAPLVMMALPVLVAAGVLAAWASPGVRRAVSELPLVRDILWVRDNLAVQQHLIGAHKCGDSTASAFEEAAGLCVTERGRSACRAVARFFRGEVLPGEALRSFQDAAVAAGWEADFAYVYGVGLDTGRAEEALGRLVERYHRRLDELIAAAERAVEVGLLLAAGGLVGATVGTFYSTLYSLITRFG
jgi:type II secretory pathway component PulF